MSTAEVKTFKKPKVLAESIVLKSKAKSVCKFKFTYLQAQRLHPCLYEPLINELYENACPIAVEFFRQFMERENELFNMYKSRLCDDTELLVKVYENAKMAEIKWKTGNDIVHRLHSLQCIYDIFLMLENEQKRCYEWVAFEGMNMLLKFLEFDYFDDVVFDHLKARVWYKFALSRIKKGSITDQVCNALNRAFQLSQAQDWPCDTKMDKKTYPCLHTAISIRLAQAYQKYSWSFIAQETADVALKYHSDAIFALGTLDLKLPVIRKHYYNAFLYQADCYIALSRQPIATEKLRKLRKLMEKEEMPEEFTEVASALCKSEGDCLLSEYKVQEACDKYLEANELIIDHDFKELLGNICIGLGRAFRLLKYYNLSDTAFQKAETLFTELGDQKNLDMLKFHKAQMEAERLMPQISQLMKSKSVCDYLSLLRWKVQYKPFWTKRTSIVMDCYRMHDMHAIVQESIKKKLQMWQRRASRRLTILAEQAEQAKDDNSMLEEIRDAIVEDEKSRAGNLPEEEAMKQKWVAKTEHAAE